MDAFECYNIFYAEPSFCIVCITDLDFIFIILESRINWIYKITRGWYIAWDSQMLKRRSYPRVEDKKYLVFTNSDIYGDPNVNQF